MTKGDSIHGDVIVSMQERTRLRKLEDRSARSDPRFSCELRFKYTPTVSHHSDVVSLHYSDVPYEKF